MMKWRRSLEKLMLMNDKWIKKAIENNIIEDGNLKLVQRGVMSYGVSSYGYDVRLESTVKVLRDVYSDIKGKGIIDPKACDEHDWITYDSKEYVIIPPYSFALGYTHEYFRMPSNITGIVFPKSSYARCGLNCLQTVIEAGWEGQITLEFANLTPNAIKLYTNEGCAQILFFEGEQCECTYADRKGKYQGQRGVTLARVSQ